MLPLETKNTQQNKNRRLGFIKYLQGNPQVIIGVSLYCRLLGRSLQESYWTDWMNTLNSQDFYQEASVDSERTEEQ